MSSVKMMLGTGEEIALTEFGHNHLVLLCEDISAFRAVEDKLHAQGALESVQITTRGEVIADITGMEIAGTQTMVNSDGSITGHIYTQGSTYVLDGGEYAQAGRILLGEE